MGALGISEASDLGNALLDFYVKKGPLMQTMQERPLLAMLESGKETFPAGKDLISGAVQGTVMSDTAGFFAGYAEDDALTFQQPDNILRYSFSWYELNAGFKLSWTEMKKDGITVGDNSKMSEHSGADAVRIAGSLFKARLANYVESWARSMNDMCWRDGSQDAKAVPGVLSILTDVPNAGTTGGLERATYTWWRHRARLGALAVTANTGPKIASSATDQTLTKTLRSELRQLRRYGGRPNKALCGSGFIEKLENEVAEKGIYTQEGFVNKGKTDLGMAEISLRGLGTFEYDPTLDDLGYTNRCYIMDTRHLKLRPMVGEENKLLEPERPYNYAAYFRTMTWTGGLIADQLNCHGVYEAS
jgi:hypothetical protein